MDHQFFLGFSCFLGIGPTRLKKLIKIFKSVKKAYQMSKSEAMEVLGNKLGNEFIKFKNDFDAVKKQQELDRKGIAVFNWNDKNYPELLKNINDPPICLYIKGNIHKIDFNKDIFFSIVGTRKPSAYGQYVAQWIASELIDYKIILVSGMAIGIDSVVHKAAINNNGLTIAVLGCGVDVVYPSINKQIYQEIINQHGLVISEFPPGEMVNKGFFVTRNRIISGISKGLLVIEGLKHSGTLITARQAAEQGKDVFAVPAPITSPLSEAPNLLIKQGAKLTTSAKDIIEELGISYKYEEGQIKQNNYILKTIKNEAKNPDEISKINKISITQVLQDLSIMEIEGSVIKLMDGKYQVRA